MKLPLILLLDFRLAILSLLDRFLKYPYLLNRVSNDFVIDQKGFIKITKKVLVSYLIIFIAFSGTGLFFLFNPFNDSAEAAWFNDNWAYRKALTITIDSQSAARSNVYALLTLDTNLTSTKLQSACQDLRFTDINGNSIPYYIPNTSSCNTNSTNQIWVLLPSVPASTTSYVFYMYYGNPSAVTGSNISQLPLIDGLQGYWKLNESSGTAADNSVNSNTLTNNNTTTYTTGQFANAASFASASSQSLSITDASQTGLDNMSALTLAFWVNPTTLADNSRIIGKDSTNGNCSYNLAYDFNGALTFESCSNGFYGTGISGSTATSFISTSTWTHVVITSANGIVNIYKNGSLQTSGNFPISGTSSTVSNSSSAFGIGGFSSNGSASYMNGKLDDVRVYNRDLSTNEIYSLYNNPGEAYLSASSTEQTPSAASEVLGPSPTLYWEFDQAQGTTAEDATSNGLDGTLNNSPTWQTENLCIAGFCLNFRGSNQNVSLADNDKIDFAAADNFTLGAWVKRNGAVSANSVILQKTGANIGSTYTGYKLYMDASGDLCFDIQDGTNAVDSACTSAVDFDDDSWHFVQGVKAGTTSITLYVDGKQRAQDASIASTGTLANSSTYRVGVDSDGTSNDWVGFIDEVKIYRDQSARTASQVLADFNSRSNPEGVAQQQGNNNQNMPAALSNGLLGYWKTDQTSWNGTSGEVIDSSGNAINGTAQGGATTTASGKFNYAASLDGTNDYVSVSHSNNLNLSNAVTLSAWIYINSLSASDAGIARKDGEYSLRLVNNGTIGGKAYGCSGVQSVSTPSTGAWHHVAWTYDLKVNKVYIDGNLDNSSQETCNIPTTTNNFEIGLMDGYFNGRIDEIRVYNRTLSPSELSQLYNWAPGPVGYWRMDDGSGSTIKDSSGNGLTSNAFSGNTTFSAGQYGKGLYFDGTNDSVTISEDPLIDLGKANQSYTVSLWVKGSSVGGNTYFASKGSSFPAPGAFTLSTNNFNTPFFIVSNSNWSTSASADATTNIMDNKWHHIAGVRNEDTDLIYIYVDGRLEDTTVDTTAGTDISTDVAVYLGTRNDGGDDFNGFLDEFKLYNYARTASQIVQDMNASHPAPGSPVATPIGHWKFDEGYSTTLNNSGNGGSTYNGASSNMASPPTSDSGWTNSGRLSRGLAFDGSDDVVTVTNGSAIDLNDNLANFTFSSWIYPDSDGESDTGQVFNKGTNTYLRVDSQGSTDLDLECNLDRTTDTNVNVTDALTTGAWSHVACSWDGTTLSVFVNGLLRGSSSSGSGAIAADANNLLIGGGTSNNFDGRIDEFKVYNGALTPSQLTLDANAAASQVLGALSNNSTAGAPQAASQEYCVPGDSSTCTAPVLRYDLEEGSGTTANDSSGSGNTGTITAGTGAYSAGKVGKGYTFDGADTVINAGSGTTLDDMSGISLEAWIYPRTTGEGSNAFIIDKNLSNTQNAGWIFHYTSNQGLLFVVDGSTDLVRQSSNSVVPLNRWSHIALTWGGNMASATTVRMFVNGIETGYQTTTNGASRVSDAARSLYVGNASSSDRTFDGFIDQVRVFNYERTPSQVAWSYNKSAPVAYWKMDECQGTTINDSSGNSNVGTLNVDTPGTCATSGSWFNGATGKRNYSMDFDGIDDDITISSSLILPTSATEVTLAAWVNLDSRDTSGAEIISLGDIVSLRADDTTGSRKTSGFFYAGSSVWHATTSGVDIAGTGWKHVAYTYKSGQQRIYINGIPYGTTTQTGLTWSGQGSNTKIAEHGNGSGNYNFNGRIDDARVYGVALTETQVKSLFNAGAAYYGPVTGAP